MPVLSKAEVARQIAAAILEALEGSDHIEGHFVVVPKTSNELFVRISVAPIHQWIADAQAQAQTPPQRRRKHG